jgi:hypothetical protein
VASECLVCSSLRCLVRVMMSVLIFSSPTGPPEPFADMFVELWVVVGIGEACSGCWREKRLLWWVRVRCTRKRPDQCFQSFSRRCWQRLRAGGCVGMISQRWSNNALFGRWMIQCGAVCNAAELVLSMFSRASSSHDREDGHMDAL